MAGLFGIMGLIAVLSHFLEVCSTFVNGLEWAAAPEDVKNILRELLIIKASLLEIYMDVAFEQTLFAFHSRNAKILSRLAPYMISTSQTDLKDILADLEHRCGWDGMRELLLSQKAQKTVETLQLLCQLPGDVLAFDGALHSASVPEEDEDQESGPTSDCNLQQIEPVVQRQRNPDGRVSKNASHTYEKLEDAEHSIRLLTIDLSSPASQINCSLRTVRITDSTPYVAVSYVWGDDTLKESICLDGAVKMVTTNLFVALCQFRSDNHPGPFWIDAVCIDQANEKEKTVQVQRMGTIFGNAAMVLAWLGPAMDDSDTTIQQLRELGPRACHCNLTEIKEKWPAGLLSGEDADFMEEVQSRIHLSEFGKLCDRPFWSRIWILQELSLNPAIILQCGAERLRWDHFRHMFAVLTIFSIRLGGPTSTRQHWLLPTEDCKSFPMIRAVLEQHNARLNNGPIPSITTVLPIVASHLQASYPSDMVYGLLGITTGAAECGIEVDYAKSHLELYLQIGASLLEEKRLGALSLADGFGPRSHPKLPSWVPDWTRSRAPKLSGRYNRSNWLEPQAQSLFITDYGDQKWILSAQGFRVGTVHGKSNTWDAYVSTCPLKAFRSWFDELESLVLKGSHVYTVEEERNAVMQTPIAANSGCDRQLSYQQLRGFPSQDLDLDDEDEVDEFLEEHCDYYRVMNATANKRRAFVLQEGYIGLGPQSLQEGDMVWVFPGASLPFLLRPLHQGYELLGEAYVHGLTQESLLVASRLEWVEIC
jgi:hypothetical protein